MEFFFDKHPARHMRSPEELMDGFEQWQPSDGSLSLRLQTPWELDYEAKVWGPEKVRAVCALRNWSEFVEMIWCETDCLVAASCIPGCALVKMAPVPAPSLGVVDCCGPCDVFLVPSGFFDEGAGGRAVARVEKFRERARPLGNAASNVEAYELLRQAAPAA